MGCVFHAHITPCTTSEAALRQQASACMVAQSAELVNDRFGTLFVRMGTSRFRALSFLPCGSESLSPPRPRWGSATQGCEVSVVALLGKALASGKWHLSACGRGAPPYQVQRSLARLGGARFVPGALGGRPLPLRSASPPALRRGSARRSVAGGCSPVGGLSVALSLPPRRPCGGSPSRRGRRPSASRAAAAPLLAAAPWLAVCSWGAFMASAHAYGRRRLRRVAVGGSSSALANPAGELLHSFILRLNPWGRCIVSHGSKGRLRRRCGGFSLDSRGQPCSVANKGQCRNVALPL